MGKVNIRMITYPLKKFADFPQTVELLLQNEFSNKVVPKHRYYFLIII